MSATLQPIPATYGEPVACSSCGRHLTRTGPGVFMYGLIGNDTDDAIPGPTYYACSADSSCAKSVERLYAETVQVPLNETAAPDQEAETLSQWGRS